MTLKIEKINSYSEMFDRKFNDFNESHYTESVNWSRYMKLRNWESKRIYLKDSNGIESFIHFYFKSKFFTSYNLFVLSTACISNLYTCRSVVSDSYRT